MTVSGASWSSRSIASSFQHRLFYLAIRLGGWKAAYIMLLPVVLFYSLKPSLRNRSRPYLEKMFPAAGPWMRFVHAFRLNLEFGKVLVDRAAQGITGRGKVAGSLQDRERLKSLLAEGRGLILLTAHVGSWQTSMVGMGNIDAPVGVVYRRDPGDVDRLYHEHSGAAAPVRFIDPGDTLGAVLTMTDILRRGGVLCIMGDRVFGGAGSSVDVQFLSRKAPFPYGAFKIASATGAPVVFVLSHRTGPCESVISIQNVRRMVPRMGREAAAYGEYVQEFARTLECFAAQHPYQFFNFFDMWEPNAAPQGDGTS